MKRYILALDQGTTSSRAILFDREQTLVQVAQREFTQHYPKPGWVEHDAEEILSVQLQVAREVLAKAGADASEVAAIGITNQRETVVVWDKKTGKPICPAIVWQCRRTAEYCDALRARGLEPLFREKTGLLLDTGHLFNANPELPDEAVSLAKSAVAPHIVIHSASTNASNLVNFDFSIWILLKRWGISLFVTHIFSL